MTKRDEILAGVTLVGPWPGQDREYRRDDWEGRGDTTRLSRCATRTATRPTPTI